MVTKEQFLKKLKYGDRYCQEHNYISNRPIFRNITVMFDVITCPECHQDYIKEQSITITLDETYED